MNSNKQLQTQKKTINASPRHQNLNLKQMTRTVHPASIIQRTIAGPESLTMADVLQLQQTIGNQAVGQLLAGIGRIPSTTQLTPVQRQELEEEELLQGKMIETVQRQGLPEEEELMQGKMMDMVQRQESEEEELLQGKFTDECVQCQIPEEEEELMQGKFASGPTGTLQAKEEAPPNRTGMPDHLKSGLENLSGIDLSGVRVHYRSSKPAQLNALAYTRGQEIHVAPGQEKHLPHEGWHAVQQMQGRVKPTMQMEGTPVNDDAGLENEADAMGGKAVQMKAGTCQECSPDNHRVAKVPWKNRGETQQESTVDLTPFYAQVDKPKENKGMAIANCSAQKKRNGKQDVGFVDNRLEATNIKGMQLAVSKRRSMMDKIERPVDKKNTNIHNKGFDSHQTKNIVTKSNTIQRVIYPNMNTMWAAVHPGYALTNITGDSALSSLYNDAAAQLPDVDFIQTPNTAPQISPTPLLAHPFKLDWDTAANLNLDDDYFAGAIIHELVHAASSQMYTRHGANQFEMIWGNLNLPAPVGIVDPNNGLTPNQLLALHNQIATINDNYSDLEAKALENLNNGTLTNVQYNHVYNRIQYAKNTSFVHNESVLADIMYYLRAKGKKRSRTYKFARRMLKEANDRRRNGFWSNTGTEVRRVDRQAFWFQFWKW